MVFQEPLSHGLKKLMRYKDNSNHPNDINRLTSFRLLMVMAFPITVIRFRGHPCILNGYQPYHDCSVFYDNLGYIK